MTQQDFQSTKKDRKEDTDQTSAEKQRKGVYESFPLQRKSLNTSAKESSTGSNALTRKEGKAGKSSGDSSNEVSAEFMESVDASHDNLSLTQQDFQSTKKDRKEDTVADSDSENSEIYDVILESSLISNHSDYTEGKGGKSRTKKSAGDAPNEVSTESMEVVNAINNDQAMTRNQDNCFVNESPFSNKATAMVENHYLEWREGKKSLVRNIHIQTPKNKIYPNKTSPQIKYHPKTKVTKPALGSSDEDWTPDTDTESDYEVCASKPCRVTSDSESEDDHQKKETKVTVSSVKKKDIVGRVYDKKNSCFFCGKELAKIARHYLMVHKGESDVQKISALKMDSKERKNLLAILRERGNFHHNLRIQKTGGELKVHRRPSRAGVDGSMYTPCVKCFKYVLKRELWRHNQTCIVKNEEGEKKTHRRLQYESSLLVHPVDGNQAVFREVVIGNMRRDGVLLAVKNDPAIIRYVLFLFESQGQGKKAYISEK